jgi:hypothetical protein
MKKSKWLAGTMGLLALGLAAPTGAAVPALTGLGPGGFLAALGCATCAGAGIVAVLTATPLALAQYLWMSKYLGIATACVGVCVTALTY